MHVVYVVHVVQGQGNSFGLFRCVFADLKTSRSRIPRLGLGPSQGRRSNLWFSLPNLPISSNCEALIFRPAMLRAQAVWPSLPTRPCFYFFPCVSPFSSMISMHIPFIRFIDVLVICRDEGVVERSVELL